MSPTNYSMVSGGQASADDKSTVYVNPKSAGRGRNRKRGKGQARYPVNSSESSSIGGDSSTRGSHDKTHVTDGEMTQPSQSFQHGPSLPLDATQGQLHPQAQTWSQRIHKMGTKQETARPYAQQIGAYDANTTASPAVDDLRLKTLSLVSSQDRSLEFCTEPPSMISSIRTIPKSYAHSLPNCSTAPSPAFRTKTSHPLSEQETKPPQMPQPHKRLNSEKMVSILRNNEPVMQEDGTILYRLCSSGIASDPSYVSMMESLCHSAKVLMDKGYPFRQLTIEELERKNNRCGRCLKSTTARRVRNRNCGRFQGQPKETKENFQDDGHEELAKDKEASEEKPKCLYHSGTMANKTYTCCGGNQFTKPCMRAKNHEAKEVEISVLQGNWKMYETSHETRDPRPCVAIDCEMGVGIDGDSELIRITAIDYYSSEVLLDRLVFPDNPLLHPNTRFSGVSFVDLKTARQNGTAILGRDAARDALLNFVNRDTILVGHSVNNDLVSLRWIHYRIVDTYLLDFYEDKRQRDIKVREFAAYESMAIEHMLDKSKPRPPTPTKPDDLGHQPSRSLKTLSKQRLNRVIQGGAHDSLEDTLASRDLLNWWILNKVQPSLQESSPKGKGWCNW
ncbi:hypothetical protein Cpir12675_000484 [Ceratocystis pirilliformis]|uniref:Exonuclease domain-containing protein n=1 Tax=Ceratocystis pirilliformis TaxID=259994 RepID=A0ABR3ZKJ3_9PEZI